MANCWGFDRSGTGCARFVGPGSPWHGPAAAWLERSLNGHQRVGLAWPSIGAFRRIVTHPRVVAQPLPAAEAWALVAAWLEAGPTWVPTAGERTAAILGDLLTTTHVTGNLVRTRSWPRWP